METENDRLVQDLWTYTREILGFEHLFDVQPNLHAGWNESQRAWACASEIEGTPAVIFDASYKQWEPAAVIDTYLHECGHHLLHHVPYGRVRQIAAARPAQPTPAGLKLFQAREDAANKFAVEQRAKFQAWNQQRLLKQIQNDIQEIRQALVMAGRLPARRGK